MSTKRRTHNLHFTYYNFSKTKSAAVQYKKEHQELWKIADDLKFQERILAVLDESSSICIIDPKQIKEFAYKTIIVLHRKSYYFNVLYKISLRRCAV
jgi:hypothetical protein